MKLYKISKGQLITIWIFGIIAWLWALAEASSWYGSEMGGFLSIFIPFALIFYTIGWKKNNVKTEDSLDSDILRYDDPKKEMVENFLRGFEENLETSDDNGKAIYYSVRALRNEEKYDEAQKQINAAMELMSNVLRSQKQEEFEELLKKTKEAVEDDKKKQ